MSRSGGADFFLCGHQEPVPATPQRLDVSRRVPRVSQRQPQSAYDGADTLVKIYKGLVAPEFLYDLVTRNNFSWTLEQQGENSEGLRLQLDPNAGAPQFFGVKISFENSETNDWVPRIAIARQLLRVICADNSHAA